MKLTTVQKAILALIAANIIWGAASPVFKLSLENIPPFTLAFWRFFIGSVIIFPMLLALHIPVRIKLSSNKDFFLLLGNALMGITGNIIFFFLGLQLTLSINAPVIASAGPIVVFVFAIFFLKEKFSFKKLFGMLLGTVGVIVIIIEPLLEHGAGGSLTGNIYLVVATLFAVLSTLSGRVIFQRYNPITLSFWAFIIGSASFLPLSVYEYIQNPSLYMLLDWRGAMGLIFGGVFSSAIAYTFFNWGLSKISATDTSVFSYIDPVVGTVLAFFMLHEPITTPFIIGALCIFGGISIAEGRLHYHPFHKLRIHKAAAIPPAEQNVPANRQTVLKHIFEKR